jgi:pyridoxal 5-phosphate dependent beta-lyase
MANLLSGWPLPPGARIGVLRSEYGSNRMLLDRQATQRAWQLVELPVDAHSRLLLDELADALAKGLDLVVFPHIASQRGIVQPAQAAGRLCRDAGVPLVLDVCQSLGHVDTSGVGAAAYVGTSRKWLAGPRGVGFVIVPGLTEGSGPDTFAPSIGSHAWTAPGGSPVTGAARYESDEASVASRVGLAVAAQEHQALGSARIFTRLAAMGRTTRRLLDGRGGWRVAEPLDEPTAIVTLRPPAGVDPDTAVADAVRRARAASVTVGVIPVTRAPADMPTPVLRVSLPLDTLPHTLTTLAAALEG